MVNEAGIRNLPPLKNQRSNFSMEFRGATSELTNLAPPRGPPRLLAKPCSPHIQARLPIRHTRQGCWKAAGCVC